MGRIGFQYSADIPIETGHAAAPATSEVVHARRGKPRLYSWSSYFVISTLARVVSHSMRSVHSPPAESNAMVKFSTGAAVFETCMSTRANSSASYLYGMPHSAFFLLIISVHLSAFGMVKMV